jgi:hypothetical protein
MVFCCFGAEPGSWALGNDNYSISHNLSAPLQTAWDSLAQGCVDPSLAGAKISWLSSGTDGSYAIMTKQNELLSNRPDLLAVAQPPYTINHVSFSHQGAWFVRFNDGTVQVSSASHFSRVFHHLVRPFLDPSSTSRQASSITNIYFGHGDDMIIQTDHSILVSDALSKRILARLPISDHNNKLPAYSLGKNTCLCPWNKEYHFLAPMTWYPQKIGKDT